MKRMFAVMLVCCLPAVPAHADTRAVMPVTEGDSLPLPSGGADGYVAPSKDVPLYVPLTEDQQELPVAAGGEAEQYDYAPSVEQPATLPAKKAITDQVPQ